MGASYIHCSLYLAIYFCSVLLSETLAFTYHGFEREACFYRQGKPLQPVSKHRLRLDGLREQMLIRASIEGPEIDAYIIPSFDEHQNEEVAERDKRLQYLTGFTGSNAIAAVTRQNAALWTDNRYLQQANGELNCAWELYRIGGNVSLTDWLATNLSPETRVGSDPHLIPHFLWIQWEVELYKKKFINLVKVNNNLIDIMWAPERPPIEESQIRVHETRYAGEKWLSKVDSLRSKLKEMNCDAIVVTSLTEIAYMLNLRGMDIPYTPVFKGYLVISHDHIYLYTNKEKVGLDVQIHLKSGNCFNDLCATIKDYNAIWRDLRTFSQIWKKVLVPSQCVYDMGVSEAVYSSFRPSAIMARISPIIFMKAQKNDVERAGMRMAHIKDGAAMCDVMSYLEERFARGEKWTELGIKREVDRSRKAQDDSQGLSFNTIVAFGPHASLPYYAPSNVTDIEVTDQSTLVIDSGGQYLDGTTDVTRTYHFGEPTEEERKAYTSVLAGIIKLSTLKFPENIWPSEIDALSRSPVWGEMSDYPHATGHGIGSYLSVHESPIDISYAAQQKYHFKEGYFFSNEPGYYKSGVYGIRLENVLEVIDTGKKHPSGSKFLALKEITLVPYEPKLIDRTLLSAQEKRWLNDYNAKIRELVGEELKRQSNMPAFYWMMNKTRHIREYLPMEEYRGIKDNASISTAFSIIGTSILICLQIFLLF